MTRAKRAADDLEQRMTLEPKWLVNDLVNACLALHCAVALAAVDVPLVAELAELRNYRNLNVKEEVQGHEG
eukprot:9493078-Alexandrium_andersonii.AAC.1